MYNNWFSIPQYNDFRSNATVTSGETVYCKEYDINVIYMYSPCIFISFDHDLNGAEM